MSDADHGRDGSRCMRALELHEQNLSWREVGLRMGITPGAAAKMGQRAADKRAAGHTFRFQRKQAEAPDDSREPTDNPVGCKKCGLRDCPVPTFLGVVEPHRCLVGDATRGLGEWT